ncbi:MAG TPA: glutaredoxin, partial [Oceanospirillales bacterium]|nr:glutaredoxin [Oceanospirillales bacterium]
MKPKAVIYRMVMEKHICPYGQKAVYLLKKQGFDVEDHHLTTHEDTEAFKTEHGVKTTPQTFING